jgi:glycosyltransferase involved in cell wall biosynthesis
LYTGAFAFIYPSKYEGFGLPVLEAMSCGVPVIASRESSIPEVCGEAGILVDPDHPDEITDAINTLLKDPQLHGQMRIKSLNRSKEFGWEATVGLISEKIVDFAG